MTLHLIGLIAGIVCGLMLARITYRSWRGDLTDIPTPIAGLLMACLTIGTIAGLSAWRMM